MKKRPSLLYEALVRIDSLKAVGVSRHAEKRRLRAEAAARGEHRSPLAPSTGRIHSDTTLATYRAISLRYIRYCRTHGVRTLAQLDGAADHWVSAYLEARLAAGDSPFTLATIRSGLRMFHRPAFPQAEREACVRCLGERVVLPRRLRAGITRSRRTVAMDADVSQDRFQGVQAFALACGLRRREIEHVKVSDVHLDSDGNIEILVRHGKGGRRRLAPVLPGHEGAILDVIVGQSPEALIWGRQSVRIDFHSLRRAYAAALYCENGRRSLPPAEGRLPVGSVDYQRAQYVSMALGHSRVDIILRHYLR